MSGAEVNVVQEIKKSVQLIPMEDKIKHDSVEAEDRMDELTSLEREIAQMHQPTAPVVAQRVDIVSGGDVDDGDKVLLEMQPASRNSTPGSQDEATVGTTLETPLAMESCDDDLIAVLKGLDRVSEEDDKETADENNHALLDAALVEGVTIEGEGEFQIMEIDDDDIDDFDDEIESTVALGKRKPLQTYRMSPVIVAKLATKLTREEERAMAMEQMAGLQARADRHRRRKQDIKPLPTVSAETNDLVNTITAEWSDEELPEPEENSKPTAANSRPTSPKEPQLGGAALLKHTNGKTTKSTAVNSATANNEEKSPDATENAVAATEASPPAAAAGNQQNQQNTGFKRTRIIKRKIIWDPDAPETRISYSQLVRGSKKPKTGDSAKTTKKARSVTPKAQQVQSDDVSANDELPAPVNKRRAQTPVVNGGSGNANAGPGAKKKKISEVDRLMGDEGAINMLNSLENERIKLETDVETNKAPLRPMMRCRSTTISERTNFGKRELTSPVAPVAKKESPTPPVATKNKRGPKPKPSSTWDYVYKQQASEDAMIIRRRSNSSYSSTASQHRLSLDAPPPPPPPATPPNKTTKAAAKKSANATPPAPPSSQASPGDEVNPVVAVAKSSSSKGKAATKSDADATATDQLPAVVGKTFEFAKPKSKTNQKANRRTKDATQSLAATTTTTTTTTTAANQETKKATNSSAAAGGKARSAAAAARRSPALVDEKLEKPNQKSASPPIAAAAATTATTTATTAKDGPTADVVIKKIAKVSQIIFNTQKAKINYTFTAPLINKLVEALDKLSKDTDCNVVVIITNAPNFCQGVDFSDLVVGTAEKRKAAATQLATAVKNYIKTLATFPKPLIVGVNGSNSGLGVTQLPLFDIVVASDKSSYETPYARIGQVPEGYCVWNNLTKIRGTLKTKLFWLCEKLHSSESALCGLVNKLAATNRVNDEAILIAKKIAASSTETYRIMKGHTIRNHSDIIATSLDDEFDTIVKQWTSSECLDHFKKFLELGHF